MVTETSYATVQKDTLLLKFYKETSDLKKADAALKLSVYYTNMAQFDSAKFFINTLFDLAFKLKDEKKITESYMQYGTLETYQGNYSKAANYFLRNYIYAEKHNDTMLFNNTCINLASVYSALEEYNKAKYYLLKIDEQELVKNPYLNINYIGNLAQIEYELGNYQVAYDLLLKGIPLFNPQIRDVNLTQFYILAGQSATKLNKPELAFENYQKANENITREEFPIHTAHIDYGLALYYHHIKSYAKAIEFAQNSLQLAQMYQVLDLVADNYKLLSEVYDESNVPAKSLEMYKLYESASDSLKSEEYKKDIELLEASYELQKSKSAIEKLTLINDKTFLKYIIYLIISIITIIASIFLVIVLKRRNALNAQLNQSNAVKDRLLSIIAHDLKTPLNNIVMVLDEIDKDAFSPDERAIIIEALKSQTDVTIETLENLLKWGQSQLNGVKVKPENLKIETQVNRVIEFAKAQANAKGIELVNECKEDFNLYMDKEHFSFILRNYIANAIKFSNENGKIEIKVESISNSMLKISVVDHGMGIKDDDQVTIFKQAPKVNYGTNNEKGTGLGLALCKEFAEANNGSVGFSSIYGQGSAFYFTCLKYNEAEVAA